MNAVISDRLPVCTEAVNNYSVKNAVKSVTCKETSVYKANNEKYKVVLYDYGAKENIIRELLLRGCTVIRVPSCTAADEVLKLFARRYNAFERSGRPCRKIRDV